MELIGDTILPPPIEIIARDAPRPNGSPLMLSLGLIHTNGSFIEVFTLGHIQPDAENLPAIINQIRLQPQFASEHIPDAIRSVLNEHALNYPMRNWSRYMQIMALPAANRTQAILDYQREQKYLRTPNTINIPVNAVALSFGGNRQMWYIREM